MNLNAFQEAQNIVGQLKRRATGLAGQLGAGVVGVARQISRPKPQEIISPLAPTPTPDPFIQKGWEKVGPNHYRRPEPIATATQAPTATPAPSPQNLQGIVYNQRPYHREIVKIWGGNANIAHGILRYVDTKTGEVKGENVSYGAGAEMDVPNRINPNTRRWDPNAPVKTFINPLTGQREQSIDRGLFRINNETFYDFQRRFPRWFQKHGINSWDDMLDVKKNTTMAKFIFDIQRRAWYAANPETGAQIE